MSSGVWLNESGGLLYAAALLVALLVWVLQPRERRRSRVRGRLGRFFGGWTWKSHAPRSFWLVKTVFWGYVVAALLTVSTISGWAPRRADGAHPVPFVMRNGQVYYVQRWLGRAIGFAIPVGGVLLAGLALVAWLNRGQLERDDREAG